MFFDHLAKIFLNKTTTATVIAQVPMNGTENPTSEFISSSKLFKELMFVSTTKYTAARNMTSVAAINFTLST